MTRTSWRRRIGPCCRSIQLVSGLAFLACCLAGCGARDGVEVSGRVTFDGKPVPAGMIYFNPDLTKGHDGPQGFAKIEEGTFDTRQGGSAPSSGPTIVVIKGYDGSKEPGVGTMGNPLFHEFHEATDLPTGNIARNFEVPASAGEDMPKAPPRTGRRP